VGYWGLTSTRVAGILVVRSVVVIGLAEGVVMSGAVSERVEHLPSAPGCDGASWSAHCSCGWSSWGHVSPVGAWQAESAHRVRVGVDSVVAS
jgi:hypothetical protein